MTDRFSNCSLYLCPQTIETIDPAQVLNCLKTIGLLGLPLDTGSPDGHDTNAYFTGDHYLELVNYLGCSPSVAFEPAPDNHPGNQSGDPAFCHIRLHVSTQPGIINCRAQPKKPQCPHCNKPLASWQPGHGTAVQDPSRNLATSHNNALTDLHCENCGNSASPHLFNWRKSAGVACIFVEITDIFPREAVPQDNLLNALENATGYRWQHFYACTA